MIQLNKYQQKEIEIFYSDVFVKLRSKLNKSRMNKNAKSFFSDDRINELIYSEPDYLMGVFESFLKHMGNQYSLDEYKYFLGCRKLTRGLNDRQKAAKKKYGHIYSKLKKVFNYDEIISKRTDFSYSIAQQIGRNTCVYCNRLYTFTVVDNDSLKKYVTRPQFDHWIPKSAYPIFALSFYNLIPTCNVCNSSAKGDAIFDLDTHIHPYLDDLSELIKFSYSPIELGVNKVEIKTTDSRAERFVEDIKLREEYEKHCSLELQDLYDLRYKYSKNYLHILFNNTFDLSEVSQDDAYRMLFGTELAADKLLDRPLSKFKKDILEELDIL